MEKNENDIKNALLATPCSKEGIVSLEKAPQHNDIDYDGFFQSCFVDADFISLKKMMDNINESVDKDGFAKNQDYDFFASSSEAQKQYRYEIKLRTEQAQKDQFEKDLLGTNDANPKKSTYSSIFLIEGPAGSGKTTYASYLLRRKVFNVDYCDFEYATQTSCGLLNNTYDFKQSNRSPVDALELLFVSTLHDRMTWRRNISESEYRTQLTNIVSVYNEYFNSKDIATRDDAQFRNFFGIIEAYSVSRINYQIFSDKVYEFVKEAIEGPDPSNNPSEVYGVKILLGIIIRLYFCYSTLAEHNQKQILFLDNIERFIKSELGRTQMIVFDKDIQRIICSIYSIADRTEDLLRKTYRELSKLNHSLQYHTTYGIVIATRESTLALLKKSASFTQYFEVQHAENLPTYVNISNWFDYYKIFCKKIRFFLGEDEESENYCIHALSNILKDITASRWSLRNLLLSMFNYNYRRFFSNLTEAFCSYKTDIEFYNTMWETAKTQEGGFARAVKHLCRKLVLRVVLEHMQRPTDEDEEGFFDSIGARCDYCNPTITQTAGFSCPRRLLTYLDNKKRETHKPVPFGTLVETLFEKPYNIQTGKSKVERASVDRLARIITTVGRSAKIYTNGIELVAYNIDRFRYPEQNLADVIWCEWNDYIKNKTAPNYLGNNIQVTPAGSAIALICPSFEFFCCRYQYSSIPLFMLKSEKERAKLIFGTNSRAFTEDDNGVFQFASRCVKASLMFEASFSRLDLQPFANSIYATPQWLFDYSGQGTGMVHALRIISDHIGYLSDYKAFLAGTNLPNFDNDHYKRNDGKGIIDIAIEEYFKLYSLIKAKYKNYINVGLVPFRTDY